MAEIVDLATRRSRNEKKRLAEEEQRRISEAEQFLEIQTTMLQMIDATRRLVEEGKLDGLVVVGRDPASKVFFNQVCLMEPFVERHDLFAYGGMLDAIKIELLDHAANAAYLDADGAIRDPFNEPEIEA